MPFDRSTFDSPANPSSSALDTSAISTDSSRRDFLKLFSLSILGMDIAPTETKLSFVCSSENDLFKALGSSTRRFAHAEEAIAQAEFGSGILILAELYPDARTPFSQELVDAASRKEVRLFVEYPVWVPGQTSTVQKAESWDRAIITSDRFGAGLSSKHIMSISDCHYVALSAHNADIVLARVAGFDTAVFGLADTEQHPVLFEAVAGTLLVATTKLSHFRTARYGPSGAWLTVWKVIIEWLCRSKTTLTPRSEPSVRPTYSRRQRLPDAMEHQSFRRGVGWFANARLLVDSSWSHQVDAAKAAPDYVTTAPSSDWPSGNGNFGMLEGFSSAIDINGNQPVRWALRADCMGEASLALALSSAIDNAPSNGEIAQNLIKFIYECPSLAGGVRESRTSPSFGLLNWDVNSKGMYYGDDNARCLLGIIGALGVVGLSEWDKSILRTILANFRTTGIYGFRGECLVEGQLQSNGAQFYRDAKLTHYAPHFEAYPWALYLWAYTKTRYRPLLDKTLVAIRKTMGTYPDGWEWTNGMQQERARMLLPLAWLVRTVDIPEHRAWLRLMAEELMKHQDPSGGILEEVGRKANGRFGPPISNAKYGSAEAPLIQQNGDAVCDLLYTVNFAFLGLHEAAAATNDPYYARAEEQLARFLCRIQITSEDHPELDGGWFRAFAPGFWDYWASNSDKGWGAWAIESGWTQAWISSVFGMRLKTTSLWTLANNTNLTEHMDEVTKEFAESGGL